MTDFDDIDIEGDANFVAGDLSQVRYAAERMRGAQREIDALETKLAEKKAELHKIESQELPDIMATCGIKEFTLESGEKIEVKDILKASIPSKSVIEKASPEDKPELEYRRAEAFSWLRDNGLDPLIKNILEVEFGKNQDNMVKALADEAEKLGLPHRRDESVHSASLEKALKEKISLGIQIPMDTFAIYTGKKAVIASVRKKKAG